MTVIVSDTFTRANGPVGSAETGQTWTALPGTGVWEVVSNQLALTTPTSQAFLVAESGVSDCTVSAQIVFNSAGLCFRCTDENNLYLYEVGSGELYKRESGGFSLILTTGVTGGGTYAAVLNGSSITIHKNGVDIGSVTNSFNATATRHGFRCFADTFARFDDFLVESDTVTDAGVLAATLPTLVASLDTTATTTGVLAATLPTLVASLDTTATTTGVLAADLPPVTAALSDVEPFLIGTIIGQLPAPDIAAVATVWLNAVLAGILPVPTSDLSDTLAAPPPSLTLNVAIRDTETINVVYLGGSLVT